MKVKNFFKKETMHHISGVHLILSSCSQPVTSLRYLLFGFDSIVSWFSSELWKVELSMKVKMKIFFTCLLIVFPSLLQVRPNLGTLSINHPCHSDVGQAKKMNVLFIGSDDLRPNLGLFSGP